MRVAHICPPALLEDVFLDWKTFDYHLALPQLVNEHKDYARFYCERRARGQHVILDNGAFELGESVELGPLTEAYLALKPTEIVLPDKRFGTRRETVEMAQAAIDHFERVNHEMVPKHQRAWYMAVPHGRTWDDYLACAAELAHLPSISCLAIVGETMDNWGKTRVETAQAVARLGKAIHMFGCLDDLSDIMDPWLRQRARGFDTGKFIRWGLDETRVSVNNIPKYPGRNKGGDFFKRKKVTDAQLDAIWYNMDYWTRFAGSGR